jgi:phosphatidylinositol alpha-mannosyltransferase
VRAAVAAGSDLTPRALRIAVVSEYAYPMLGGVSEHVHGLSRELARRGHRVTLVTGGAPGDPEAARELDLRIERAHGYRTTRVGHHLAVRTNGSVGRFTLGLGLERQVAHAVGDVDVLHVHGSPGPVVPLMALRTATAPVVVGTFHTYFEGQHPGYRLFHRYIGGAVSRMTRRIAVSRACVESISPVFPGRYEVIPNGVDCSRFRPPTNGARPSGPPRILFVGRFAPRNGLGVALLAMRLLGRTREDAILQVVGGGGKKGRYQRLASELGLAGRVEWLGPMLEGRIELFRQATALIAPVTKASFGVLIAEAMASGLPIVCAANVGFRETLAGTPAHLVAAGDAAGYARGLERVLADPDLRAEWGAAGREVARREYDWPLVARRVERVYLDALDAA